MRLASFHSKSVRSLLLAAGVPLGLALGCSQPLIATDEIVQTNSCVSGARSMVVEAAFGGLVGAVGWEGGSSNVVGTPTILSSFAGAQVIAELDNVAIGDEVTLRFSATISPGFSSITVTDIKFYSVPPDQIGMEPGCTPGVSPEFALLNEIMLGLDLHVSNPTAQPLTLARLELVEAPAVLPLSSLDWTAPDFNALPWTAVVTPGTQLDAGAPPLVIDLPDAATDGPAALCRYVSVVGGHELRGIVQVDLAGVPVSTQAATWSAVKARFRR